MQRHCNPPKIVEGLVCCGRGRRRVPASEPRKFLCLVVCLVCEFLLPSISPLFSVIEWWVRGSWTISVLHVDRCSAHYRLPESPTPCVSKSHQIWNFRFKKKLMERWKNCNDEKIWKFIKKLWEYHELLNYIFYKQHNSKNWIRKNNFQFVKFSFFLINIFY